MRSANHAPFRFISMLAVLLAGAFAVHAEEAVDAAAEGSAIASAATSESTPTDLPDGETEVIALSLREAVNLAIENNLGVEVARHAPLIAERDMQIAWGAYDPTFTGDVSYASSRSASGSSSFAPNADLTDGGAGISGLIPYLGATLSIEYSASQTKNNPINTLSPKYETGLDLVARIPLLKNLVWNAPWTQVEVTGLLHSSSLEDFRRVIMDMVLNTAAAYWDLVALKEKLRVAKKSLQTSKALREQTQTQYEVGVKSKVEVIQADAGVASRELEVIRADAVYRNSQDNLTDAVYGVRLTPTASLHIQPTDDPSNFDVYDVDPKIATDLAMKNRPELAILELDIERRETLVRFRKNQRLPQLDLNLTYGTSGLEGKGNLDYVFVDPENIDETIPKGTGGRYSDTHDDWFRKRGGREYSVGGMFSIPLGNTAPRHSVSKARLELRRAKTQLMQLHQQIILEIRRDIRLLEAALKGIDASERQRIAAEEQLRAERIRLEYGESTPFDVLQKESDLVEAEVSKIQAFQLYQTSASALDRAQGTILRTHNIVVGSVSGLRNGMEAESFALEALLEPILP